MQTQRIGIVALIAACSATIANAQKLVISEVLSNEVGSTYNGEWIEIYNGTDTAIDLSTYKIGDEETKLGTGVTEGMFQFPSGATIAAGETQTISSFASRFIELYGFRPTYEVGAGAASEGWIDDTAVPNMTTYTAWDADGDRLNMANANDQVLLLDGSDQPVDALSWGTSTFFMNPPAPQGGDGQGQERFDVTIDTDAGADWQVVTAAPAGAFWTSKSTPGTVNISRFIADSDVNWSDVATWNGGGVPNRQSWIANFAGGTTAARTVTLDVAATLGQLNLDDANGVMLAGTQTLTLNRAAAPAQLHAKQGSHVIQTPVVFASAATVTVDTGASLSLSGDVSAAGFAVTKAGAGPLAVKHLRGDGLAINAGSVSILAANADTSTSLLKSLTIADGASLDLNDNALVLDYTAGTTGTLERLSHNSRRPLRGHRTIRTYCERQGTRCCAEIARVARENVDSEL